MQSSVCFIQMITEIVENKYFGTAEISSGLCVYSSHIIEVINISVSHSNSDIKLCPLFLQNSVSSCCTATCIFLIHFFKERVDLPEQKSSSLSCSADIFVSLINEALNACRRRRRRSPWDNQFPMAEWLSKKSLIAKGKALIFLRKHCVCCTI